MSELELDVFIVPYRPILAAVQPMSPGEACWPAISNTLISGERDAVLVDTPLVAEDAERLVAWIRAKRKNLTTVYITHGHGDHFFGLETVLDAFPSARGITAPEIVPSAEGQLEEDAQRFWNAILPGRIPEAPRLPEPFDGDLIELEGEELRIIDVGQADTTPTTIVHVPTLEAVVTGDVAYNGIHQYMAETDREKRTGWIASIEQVRELHPKRIVAGHQDPKARDDMPSAILDSTETYILDFERSLAESDSPQELVDRMIALHGDRTTPHSLWVSAVLVFQQERGGVARR
jgi:glyoxylase-like metal-dependent hydrolase (beta-lactamase superfamily II)